LGGCGSADHVDAADVRAARRWDHARRQHADRRRLARAVRAEHSEDLAAPHGEIEIIDGPHLAAATVEHLRQVLEQDYVTVLGYRALVAASIDRHRAPFEAML